VFCEHLFLMCKLCPLACDVSLAQVFTSAQESCQNADLQVYPAALEGLCSASICFDVQALLFGL
jgi:hypothetical protein